MRDQVYDLDPRNDTPVLALVVCSGELDSVEPQLQLLDCHEYGAEEVACPELQMIRVDPDDSGTIAGVDEQRLFALAVERKIGPSQ